MSKYKFSINGKEYNVEVASIEGGKASVNVNGKAYEVVLDNAPSTVGAAQEAKPAPPVNAQASPAKGTPAKEVPAPAPAVATGVKTITSPLPGVIISIDVKEGEKVSRGQKVAVIEAMKMENDILAECDGTVSAVLVSKGDSVLEGAGIVKIG